MRKSALFAFGLVTAALVALGLVVLASAGSANSLRIRGDALVFLKRQALYVAVGLVIAVVLALFDYHRYRDHVLLTISLFAVTFVLLLVVLKCPALNGSRRWINLSIISLQPGELAKFTLVVVLAVWLDRIAWRVETFSRGALCSGGIIALLCVPIMFEPDYGSMLVVAGVGLLLLFVGGTRILHLGVLAMIGLPVFAYRILTNSNRMARLAAFFGQKVEIGAEVADAAARRASDQVTQALVAIKNGGLFGVGLGKSLQKHRYLPEAHTDFIFAIGAEEMGLVFSVAVLLLFLAFFFLAVHIARHAADRLGRFLVVGGASIIFVQAMINLGVVCGALPTKGMALPFFSYGGTNMLCSFAEVGLILSVGIHAYRVRKRGRSPATA